MSSTNTAVIAGIVVAITVFGLGIGSLYYYALRNYYQDTSPRDPETGIRHLQRPRRRRHRDRGQQQQQQRQNDDDDVETGNRAGTQSRGAQQPQPGLQEDTVSAYRSGGREGETDVLAWSHEVPVKPPQRGSRCENALGNYVLRGPGDCRVETDLAEWAQGGDHSRGRTERAERRKRMARLGVRRPRGQVWLGDDESFPCYDGAAGLERPVTIHQPSIRRTEEQMQVSRDRANDLEPLRSNPPDPSAVLFPLQLPPVVAVRCRLPKGHRRSIYRWSASVDGCVKEAWDPDYFARHPRPSPEPSLRTAGSRRGRAEQLEKIQAEVEKGTEMETEQQTQKQMETGKLTETQTSLLQAEEHVNPSQRFTDVRDTTDFRSSFGITETQTSASKRPTSEPIRVQRSVEEPQMWKRNGVAANGRCSWSVVEAYALRNGWVGTGRGEEVVVVG
ncbi:hypothetical protein K490DRAFT_66611 [Saccharata proteae CBS 121410]|uniref:Uncharacterized protein n=1 Tax=Saccharata proteae CBS 121410 TaxID=1314787 RepID=A0A9P4LXT5_9PEZI|nr:hypothetical protein K490DRAFT_66611 [Saccharata proteae CBS 121410]